ncbi:MAG: hypothetical protein Q8N30_05225 [Methylococcales bacterium]|nr:hypothetical protein [Methylococcales bacterium]
MNSNLSNNPNGKILEVADFRRYDSDESDTGSFKKYFGIALFLLSLLLCFVFSLSLLKGSGGAGVVFIALIGIVIGLRMYNSGVRAIRDAQTEYNIREDTRTADGISQNYLINSQNNTLTLPNATAPYCKLSDIDAVNKRVESSKRRERYSEYVNGKFKEKHRTVTDYTYYVQIVGSGISSDFNFKDQGVRDSLYSSLKVGIKESKDFFR